jgi:hypothetical protein
MRFWNASQAAPANPVVTPRPYNPRRVKPLIILRVATAMAGDAFSQRAQAICSMRMLDVGTGENSNR